MDNKKTMNAKTFSDIIDNASFWDYYASDDSSVCEHPKAHFDYDLSRCKCESCGAIADMAWQLKESGDRNTLRVVDALLSSIFALRPIEPHEYKPIIDRYIDLCIAIVNSIEHICGADLDEEKMTIIFRPESVGLCAVNLKEVIRVAEDLPLPENEFGVKYEVVGVSEYIRDRILKGWRWAWIMPPEALEAFYDKLVKHGDVLSFLIKRDDILLMMKVILNWIRESDKYVRDRLSNDVRHILSVLRRKVESN